MDSDYEAYILLLLSDGNLPTGSFVASAGLESYVTHGFFASSSPSGPPPRDNLDATTAFVRDSLATYARSALPFVSDAHQATERLFSAAGTDDVQEGALGDMKALDDLYEAMTLNHVARRASKSQGVALLTLYSKGFSRPSFLSSQTQSDSSSPDAGTRRETRAAPNAWHLPICWGVLTSALGLSLERSQFLHLFLQARSILSASVRLNTLGPYGAQQLLLHVIRPLVEAETARCKDLRTGYKRIPDDDFDETVSGPATTWPLGEILAVRHDLLHSRIFNS
ncbi:UreF-domain-containing protein [Amylocystis lapponica]|nr:UreF-domain-containing protein [Amylocystis lapponica]